MEVLNNVIGTVNGWVWSSPMIVFIMLSGLYFSIRLRFVQVRRVRDMVKQTFKTQSSSQGISTFSAFCTTMAARIGVGNIAGVVMAILHGGPGAVFWMLVMAILGSATSYVECSLGQVYKIEQDGEYRGGAYYCMDKGLGWVIPATIFALLTIVCVPILTTGIQANAISAALANSFSIPHWVSGLLGAILFAAIIFGGIKRISTAATYMVPFVTIAYLILAAVILLTNAGHIPGVLITIVKSALGLDAILGGIIGHAVSWGVTRAVASSAAGMGENTPAAAAAECDHPSQQGLANAFGVYIDMLVCLCTACMVIMTDCFNVFKDDGSLLYLGEGSSRMKEFAEVGVVGLEYTQEAIGTVVPGNWGGMIMALCVFFFAFTCVINYYYQGETAIAYLFRNKSDKPRKLAIFVLRCVAPLTYFFFTINTAGAAWGAAEIGVGLMVWFNIIVLWRQSNVAVKVFKDYEEQRDQGLEPYFNPQRVGIANADVWMNVNRDKIAAEK